MDPRPLFASPRRLKRFQKDAAIDQLTEEVGRSEQHHLTPLTSADVSRGQFELYLSNLYLTAFIYSRCLSTVSY